MLNNEPRCRWCGTPVNYGSTVCFGCSSADLRVRQLEERIKRLEQELIEANQSFVQSIQPKMKELEDELHIARTDPLYWSRFNTICKTASLQNMAIDLSERVKELEAQLAESQREIERCHAVMKVTCPSIEDLKAQLAATKLKWQTGPVPEDGFYLAKPSWPEPFCFTGIWLKRHDDGLGVFRFWAGPIPEPEE